MIPGAIPEQRELRFVGVERLREAVLEVQHAMGRNVRESGGLDQLCAELGRPYHYASKLSEALAGVDGKRPSIEVLIAQLQRRDEQALELLAKLCEIAGAAPPVRQRVATTAEMLGAVLDELEGAIGDAVLERAARRLGTDRKAFRR